MHAVVLAGGLGTRLRPYTHTIPKPLLPLGDRSVLEILVTRLRACGVSHVTLCLGHMAPLIAAFVGDGARWGLSIDSVIEEQPLGTAGALRLIKHLPSDFFVVNGDTLTDLDFAAFHAEHRSTGAWATLFAPAIDDVTDYGILELDHGSGAVRDYIEKPRRTFHVSSGIYVLSRQIVDFIPPGRFDMPDLVRRALAEKKPVRAFASGAYWRDIGRPDHYEAATRDFLDQPARFLGGPADTPK